MVDPRLAPCYGITEAAHYLKMPTSTLRAWTVEQKYSGVEGPRVFRPVIERPDTRQNLLSFVNLVEAHILLSICREHKVRLQEVRRALRFLNRQTGLKGKHALARVEFLTDGKDLFVEEFGELLNVSSERQIVLRKVVGSYLSRIQYDREGMPESLFPFSRTAKGKDDSELDRQPKLVVINPYVSFGRPILSSVGVPTEMINERFNAGETIEELAEDYGLTVTEIEEGLRYERTARAA